MLERRRGKRLQSLPGVHSSSFRSGCPRLGPIRCLDGGAGEGAEGERRGACSSASTISRSMRWSRPLLAERIEVLKGRRPSVWRRSHWRRGSMSLTAKVPTHVPEKGYEGELELRANSVAK